MGVASITQQKVITLLQEFAPSPPFVAVYDTHQIADLVTPSLSIEVEAIAPLEEDGAIVNQELIDNWLIRLSIRIHTAYRLGPVDSVTATSISDEVVRWLREHINLTSYLPNTGDAYRIFEVAGVAYNVDHASSGTTGAELIVNIHRVESYEQS